MNAYNPIQNVNTIIAERDQLKNDCANLSMQNQNYQNQLNAVINQSHGMHMTDQETIRRLCGTIASMKAQKNLVPESLIMTVWVQFGAEKQMERKKKSDI